MLRTAVHAGLPLIALALAVGCEAPARNLAAVRGYYAYDFTGARESLRADTRGRPDEQILLDQHRLGLAALADGDLVEAERGLLASFDLLSTAGLNTDRTTAAVLIREDVKVWKGEPFEQALAYADVATLYAVEGDWENTRAAAANALFRLRDFGEYRDRDTLARAAVDDDRLLDEGYEAVDSTFTYGYLLQAIAADISGGGGGALYDAALALDPDLAPLVDVLRSRDFDTLLIVAYGKGPTKVAYGPDNALSRFEPQEPAHAPLQVMLDGELSARTMPVCRVDDMARDLRWNSLEETRVAKSVIGQLMQAGGAVVWAGGNHRDRRHGDHDEFGNLVVGAGMILAGALLRAGAEADTRYLEYAPHAIYLAPLRLERPGRIELARQGSGRIVLPDVAPGTLGNPRAIYIRMHGPDSGRPTWLDADRIVYGNDATGVRPGDRPWILGGTDVSTPTRAVLAAYQAGGHCLGLTLDDLRGLYAAEDIVIGAVDPDAPPAVHRHILDGGRRLFTPTPDSLGYKRLMFTPRPPYDARSARVRDLAARSARGPEESS